MSCGGGDERKKRHRGYRAVSFVVYMPFAVIFCFRTLHRAPVGQGPPGPDWLAIAFGFWSERALATGTAWADLCLIHHHRSIFVFDFKKSTKINPMEHKHTTKRERRVLVHSAMPRHATPRAAVGAGGWVALAAGFGCWSASGRLAFWAMCVPDRNANNAGWVLSMAHPPRAAS